MRFILIYLLATAIALLGVGCDFFPTVYLVCDPDYWPNGTVSEVQAELDRSANVSEVIKTSGIDTATPLHIAAECNPDPDVAALLIKHGADVHAKDSLGNTPLYSAVGNSEAHPDVVALLLEHGADPTAEAYYRICDGLHPDAPCDVVRTTILYWAVYYPLGTSAARLLLEHGADTEINILGTAGGYSRAPLHSAAAAGEPEEIRLLLEYGADVNLRDAVGNTPLHHAKYSHSYIDPLVPVEVLINSGADVNVKNYQGEIPCQYAKRRNDSARIQDLLCK